MARTRLHELSFSLLLIFIVPCCGVSSHNENYKKIKTEELGISNFSSRELLQFFFNKETVPDKIEPAVITYPSPPNISGANPSTTPVPVPNTNPTSSSSPPSTNAVTQPVMPPPSAPPNPGQGWCVAKSGAPQAALQAALDYACGVGGVDCSVVQQGGSCYNPVTLENHASCAFNSFYQRNPVPSSCDFGATAMITSTNPSSGSCIFPTSTSSIPPPVTQTPPTPPTPAFSTPPPAPTPPAFPTPPVSSSGTATPRASGSPPSANKTNNTISGIPMGGFPNIFPTINNPIPPNDTSMSLPRTLPQPFIGGIILLAFIVHILDL